MNNTVKPATRCLRKGCRQPFSEHREGGLGLGCAEFRRQGHYSRVSGSFSAKAIEVAAAVVLGVLQGKDVRALAARKDFGVFAKTVASLASRARNLPEAPATRRPTQDAVLAHILEHGPATRVDLERALNKSEPCISAALKGLKERGMVTSGAERPRPRWSVTRSANVVHLSDRKAASV